MKFFKTLHWRLMLVLFVLVIMLMILIGTFLIYSIEDTYYNDFCSDIEMWNANFEGSEVLSDNVISSETDYSSELYKAFKVYFQVDDNVRNAYLLDANGKVLVSKNIENSSTNLEITQNIIVAMTGKTSYEVTTDSYFEYAKPVMIDGQVKYIFYLTQDRSTIDKVIDSLKQIIIYAVCIALVASIFISYLLSRAITVPIYRLKSGAEKMAEGDFTPIKALKSGDEISQLADKFNYMAKKLNSTLGEISREKSKIETLLQNMNDGVIAFDINKNLIHANSCAQNLIQFDMGVKDFDGIFNNFSDINFEEIISSDNDNITEKDIIVNNKYLKLFFAKFNAENGNIEGVICVIQDITKQEKLENMRKDFVANVSHELKTPITSIKGYSETLLENDVDRETKERFLGVINSEAERMSRIVSDLLQLSKIDSKEVSLKKEKIEIKAMLNEIISKLALELEKKEQEISFCGVDELNAYGDYSAIEQVLINVISNSIRYTPEKGRITVSLFSEHDEAIIKVKDNGMGIPKEDLPRIFERFYRVDKARTREMGGTGLGLSISKNMIEANGGHISIDSEYGKWTEVTIKLQAVCNVDEFVTIN